MPAVPSFSVDGGFWYSIPQSHRPRVTVGSIVRVPLGGRRLRGYVVEVAERPDTGLKALTGVSGQMPVFHPKLRDALVWAAHHYVAPVAATLERAAPPNLPGRTPTRSASGSAAAALRAPHPLDAVIDAALAGKRRPTSVLLSPWGDTSWLDPLVKLVAAGRSALVVVATAAEVALIAGRARSAVGEVPLVEVSGDLDDAGVTERWSETMTGGRIVIGTPRVAAWPVPGLALAVVVEEGRRAMKDRQTPTISVRRLLMTRGRLEGFSQVYVGPTPSLDLLAAGPEIRTTAPRAWPLVEVIDRTQEPPGSGLVMARTRAAINGTLRRDGKVFVFSHRRGYAPAFRCSTCHQLRRCGRCGSRPEPGEACPRCGAASAPCLACGGRTFEPLGAGTERVLAELRPLYGDRVAAAGEEAPVVVGSEADLAAVPGVDLAVAVDVDGLALGSHFRAGEEALRVLARVAGRVRRGSGRRLMLQTSLPDQPLVTALRRGEPLAFLEGELEDRRRMGYPPASEMMVVEIRGDPGRVDTDLRPGGDEDVTIMGPDLRHDVHRWLIQGRNLGGYKLALRPLVQRWRDSGTAVRIDVDPLDL